MGIFSRKRGELTAAHSGAGQISRFQAELASLKETPPQWWCSTDRTRAAFLEQAIADATSTDAVVNRVRSEMQARTRTR